MTRPLVLTAGDFKSLLFNTRPELLNKMIWMQVYVQEKARHWMFLNHV